jgi:hypothetical protein
MARLGLGEVLEVIHSSPRRFRAARAAGRTGDQPWRLWWLGDARWRFERDQPEGVQIEVRAGSTWWTVAPSGEAHTNEGHAELQLGMPAEFGLLHTRSLLACAVLEVLREERVAGRRAVVLRARPRPGGGGSRWWHLEGTPEPVEIRPSRPGWVGLSWAIDPGHRYVLHVRQGPEVAREAAGARGREVVRGDARLVVEEEEGVRWRRLLVERAGGWFEVETDLPIEVAVAVAASLGNGS